LKVSFEIKNIRRGFGIASFKKNLSQANGKFLNLMGMVNALPFGYSIDMTCEAHSFYWIVAT
jgi:hypothetical protein